MGFIALLSSVYRDLGFEKFDIKLSTRPEVRVGSDEVWDKAESALAKAIETAGYPYEVNPGDGAFYGPKLDFKLTDAIGREWQCGTFQVDFNLPDRLGAEYVGEDGAKHMPVMLHRAILGSFERFIGILIENYAGKLPFWLAPRQVVVASIVSDADGYVHEVVNALKAKGIRAEADIAQRKDQLQGPRTFGGQGSCHPGHRHERGRGADCFNSPPGRNSRLKRFRLQCSASGPRWSAEALRPI